MSMNQKGMETYKMKTTKRPLIILITLLFGLLGWCNPSWGHVYWDPTASSNGNGTFSSPYRDFSAAKNALASQNDDQWIIMMKGWALNADLTLDGAISGKANARVIRDDGFTGTMFSTSAYTLTLRNITLSGKTINSSGVISQTEVGNSILSSSNIMGKIYLNSGTVLRDNWATSFGAAVRLSGSGWVEMNDGCTIDNCKSLDHLDAANYPYNEGMWPGDGGAFMTGAGSTLYIKGGEITNCYASGRGGAISFWGGPSTVEITGGTISNCSAGELGGAIYLSESFSGDDGVILQNCTITGCHAPHGGAIAIRRRKEAQTRHLYTTKLTIKAGTEITECYAETGYGGALYCDETKDGFTNASSPTPNPNIYPNAFAVMMEGGKIENCYSPGMGGGLYLMASDQASSFTMTGGEIDGCYTSVNGGGAYVSGTKFTMNLNGGSIHGCKCGSESSGGNGRGGGIHAMNNATIVLDGATIYGNYAKWYGGGLQVDGATMKFYSGSIGKEGADNGNHAVMGAAGIHFVGGAAFHMTGGKFCNNFTETLGGAFHSNGTCSLTIEGGEFCHNVAWKQGGAINVDNGPANAPVLTIPTNSSVIMHDNSAGRGGAIMVDGSIMTIRSGEYYNNVADGTYVCNTDVTPLGEDDKGIGGAFCLLTYNGGAKTASILNIEGGEIHDNTATNNGGGVFMGKTTSISGGVVLDQDPEIHISGGSIYDNHADNNGGAIYLESGTFEMTAGSLEGNTASNYGGGVYVTEVSGRTLDVDIKGGHIGASGDPNSAVCGGGLYANASSGTIDITKGSIQYNEASQDGGGIYANGGTVTVNYAATSDGKIFHNYAAQKGGGLFISSTGRLDLKGKTTLEFNRVPRLGLGGGIYLEGTVQAGASSSDIIIVKDNYANDTEIISAASIDASNRNNIYLPNPVDTQTKDVITVVNDGLNLTNSKIGFSVPRNLVPVIYCATTTYLSPTIMDSDAIFEDSERYTKYYNDASPYSPNYIYLSADTWFAAVASQPTGFSYDNIDSPEDLAWLISLVNGRTSPVVTASTLSDVTVKLTNDIDMKDHLWVPIGYTGKSFNGIFDGNGHTISNVFCNYLGEGEGGTGRGLGLFGTVENATIHDVFVNGVKLEVKNQTGSDAYTMGAIANEAKGATSIYNCTAASNMESTMVNTTMGGLVGKLTSGTIHSSAAMPDMMGYAMGGLAGTNAGTIYNSFANPKFKYSGADNAYFVGGLVADNSGIIQNCYVRFSRPSTFTNATKFGQLVGKTAASKVTVCYHPTTYASGITSALVNDGSVSSTIYGDVVAPYLYNHSNDNLVGSSTETLCKKLNDWVTINNSTSDQPTCAQWKRTTAGGYVTNEGNSIGGNINGDYPIHKYSDYKCVASTDGINLDYAPTLDAMLTRHTSNATINLYAHDRTTASTGNGVVVYIDENVSLLQDVGEETVGSVIEAYTSQTLPGNPRSWHFLSSSLSNSGIGFNYGQSVAFNWEPNPCHVTISSDDDASLFPSDLPMSGGYADVARIDLYAFYEPEYHWINLKRRSDSHWHMNATNQSINYTNETELTPGKGYLVSIDQDQLLQNRGTLNNGNVEIGLDYTPAQAWAGLLGYNLIGNPYQSYLDFRTLASKNMSLWADKGCEPTYAVYDAEMGGYIQYKEGVSRGAKAANGIINMHQGFMVRTAAATTVTFTNGMRTNEGTGVSFRGEQPAYPLVNLTVTDSEGVNDFAVLELGRDADEGAEKLRANDSKGWLYLHHGSENYGILFRTEVEDYQPLWFEADEAGTYTLTWETANAEFEALTLVDNITGVMTDMLTHDSYTFEANPDQYASRFKIVIGDWKDIEENEGGPSTGSGTATFAYQLGDEIVLNVEGHLEIMDVTGRIIISRDATRHVSTNGMVPGIYILRLTDKNGTRTQKMVIE